MERHRAVVAGADGNAGTVQHLGHVVGVDARDVEWDDPAPQPGIERAVQVHIRVLGHQLDQGIADQLELVLADAAHAQCAEVVRGRAEADLGRDVRRPGLELPGDLVELGPAEVDFSDHLAAGQERGHRLEQLPAGPQRTRAGRGEHLVPGEDVEVGADRLDVDRHVGHGLGAVHEDECAGLVGHPGHFRDRIDGPERVADVGERDELRLELQEDLEDIEAEDAVVGDRDELEVGVLLLDQELPRDEVRVVLHLGQDDDVAAIDVLATPRIRDEVDRLGRVAGEHDLVRVRGVDEPGDAGAGRFIGRRGPLADLVDPAVDVRVVLAVVGIHGVNHGLRLLARGRRVEIDERLSVRGRRAEDRELRTDHLRYQATVADPGVGGGAARGPCACWIARQGHRRSLRQ